MAICENTAVSAAKSAQYIRFFVVLFIDDFLASGEAAFGMLRLAKEAGIEVAGIGIVIEKAFQAGHDRLIGEGIDVYSLARVKSMSENHIEFVD